MSRPLVTELGDVEAWALVGTWMKDPSLHLPRSSFQVTSRHDGFSALRSGKIPSPWRLLRPSSAFAARGTRRQVGVSLPHPRARRSTHGQAVMRAAEKERRTISPSAHLAFAAAGVGGPRGARHEM